MPLARRFGIAELLLLLVVVAVAAGARVWYLSTCCHQAADEGPYPVQDDWAQERDALVRNLKEGRFLGRGPLSPGEETIGHSAFLYPWMLAWLDRPANDLDVTYSRMRWIQAGLGAATAGLYFLFARRAFTSLAVAVLAGLFSAIYPYWIFNTAEINDGVVATFLLALCLFLGVRAGQVGGALTSLLYGLGFAALASVRGALLPLGFVAVLWLLWRCRSLPNGWLYGLLAFLGFVTGLVPWLTRNLQSVHEVTPALTAAYLHMWIGNNPAATGGPLSEKTMEQALDEDQPGRTEQLMQMKQTQRYQELGRAALHEARLEPGATFQRRIWAGLCFFFGESWLKEWRLFRGPGAGDDTPLWLANLARAWLAGSLLVVLLLGALGWRWSYDWRIEAMPSSLVPFWILLPYLLSHGEFFSGPRLPLDGVLLCYTALVLVCAVSPSTGAPWWRKRV